MTAAFLVYPMDVVKTHITINQSCMHRTMIGQANEIIKTNGVKGLYAGATVGIVSIFPFIAIRMSTFNYLMEQRKYSIPYNAFCAVFAGTLATLCVYPPDLLRKQM